MDRLDDLMAFIKVVEARSFTAAAGKLGISKSVVSRRMADLENRLGARLLNRTTRQLSVTEVGQAFYQRCVRIVADLEEAERAVTDLHGAPRGTLKLSAPMSFGRKHLAPAVAVFLERHPSIEIELELNDRFVDLVDEGYDLAIRIGRLKDSTLIARRLAPSLRAAVGSPDYFRRHGTPETPDDLTRHNCLIYTNTPLSEQWAFRVNDEVRPVRVAGNLKANNGDMLREAAIAGMGVVVLPTFLVGDALASGELACVLSEYTISEASVNAVYPHYRHLSPKVRVFVDFLAARFGPHPYWDTAVPEVAAGFKPGLTELSPAAAVSPSLRRQT
ncbi:MAG TPA: LysR family transcriptional regulator [Azospirillaceae bacterium]|nr:LysR family transcriptional regulator [Azospirillaceae bacterium]